MRLNAFPLSQVRLAPGPIRDRQDLNTRYLLELDPDRLLHNFRVQAGLPSEVVPLGGWEAPDCGLRGHFVGHYLSACAQGYASTADARLRDRALLMIEGLKACQSQIGTGYLSAFPETELEAIETRFEGAWASYYVLHKILAGLLDVHHHCESSDARPMAERLGDYIAGRIRRLTPEQIEGMCRTDLKPNPTNEFGGIGEILQDLADVTNRAEFDTLARVFDREWFIKPLVEREDRLTGLHANTHIPMVLSLTKRVDREGRTDLLPAIEYFWQRTAVARSYVNGGSSGPRPDGKEKSTGGEHWPAPFALAGTLTPKINESCVTHNMRRLTDALFRWTHDARYADVAERTFFNHVLTMQRPTEPGGYLYDHPLGACSHKKFGHAHDAFWCCYGSTVEAYERLAEGIFYHGSDTLWVCQYIASAVNWSEKGVRLSIESRMPTAGAVRVTVTCDEPVAFELKLRLPGWAKQPTATLNAEPVELAGAWLTLDRTWSGGDFIELRLPFDLAVQSMPDDPLMIAFRAGPQVLAAVTEQPLDLPFDYRVRPGRDGYRVRLSNGEDVPLVPLSDITDEPFGVYFRTSPRPE